MCIVLTVIFSFAFLAAGGAVLYNYFFSRGYYAENRPVAALLQAAMFWVLALLPWMIITRNESVRAFMLSFDSYAVHFEGFLHKDGKVTWLGLAALMALLIVLIAGSHRYWKRRISKWALAQGYDLVSFRGQRFWESWQLGFDDSQHQSWFAVELSDEVGEIHRARVCFGSYWGFSPGEVEVYWEDEKSEVAEEIAAAQKLREEKRLKPGELIKPRN